MINHNLNGKSLMFYFCEKHIDQLLISNFLIAFFLNNQILLVVSSTSLQHCTCFAILTVHLQALLPLYSVLLHFHLVRSGLSFMLMFHHLRYNNNTVSVSSAHRMLD